MPSKPRSPHHATQARVNRLLKQFIRSGLEGTADLQKVELLLTLALPGRDTKHPARDLLSMFGSVRGILDASGEELQLVGGVGRKAACKLRLIRAAAALYLTETAELDTPVDANRLADLFRMRIGSLPNEVFEVAYLDSSYRLLTNGVSTLSEGTVDRVIVYSRRVIAAALRRGAYALVLAHNHPSGNLAPSEHDKIMTRSVVLAGEAVGVRVIDHLIVSSAAALSFKTENLM